MAAIDQDTHAGLLCFIRVNGLLICIYRQSFGTYGIVGLLDMIKNCSYIGMTNNSFALSQYKTGLYLFDVVKLRCESRNSIQIEYSPCLFFQSSIVCLTVRNFSTNKPSEDFSHFNAMLLTNPAPIQELMLLALDEEECLGNWTENDGPKDKIAKVSS